jgi:hypothetical protein
MRLGLSESEGILQIYIFTRAIFLLLRQRVLSSIRVKYRNSSHLERAIYRARHKQAQIRSKFGFSRKSAKRSQFVQQTHTLTEAQKYLYDSGLDKNFLFKRTSNYSKRIEILPGSTSSNFKRYFTKNYLLDGSVVKREFDLGTHNTKVFTLKRISIFKFKYIYNTEKIFIFEQFIDEFESEYYGRFSEIFFSRSDNTAYGFLSSKINSVEGSSFYSIFGHYYNNYWHFLIEYLPKLFKVPKNSTVLMPSDLKFKEDFLEVIAKLELQVIEIRPDKVYYFEKLSFISTPVKYLASNSTSVDSELLLGLRSLLTNVIASKEITSKKNHYLLRTSIRRINLDSELVSKLFMVNYSCTDPYTLSISNQKSLFLFSNTILGNPGASWANFVFASNDVKFLNLVNPRNLDQSLHHAIAKVFGLELANVTLCNYHEFEDIKSNSYIDSESAANVFTSQTAKQVIEILSTLRNL